MKFNLINFKDFDYKTEKDELISYGFFKNTENLYIEKLNKKYLFSLTNKEFLNKKLGYSITIYDDLENKNNKIFIINCEEKEKFKDYEYKLIIKEYAKIIKKINVLYSTCFLTCIPIVNKDEVWKLKITTKIIRDQIYSFTKFKSDDFKLNLKRINLIIESDRINELKNIINESEIIYDSVDASKDLGNLPSNVCNSMYLHNECKKLSEEDKNIKYEYVDEDKMKKIGMNSYLNVSMGSKNKPIMSILKYEGNKKSNFKIVLIGKGLTFDTGGISLKQSQNMDEMKFDMCGAASVFGIVKAVSKLNLSINLIGILAISENSIGSKSLKPGDIITSLSGKTIEVLNTDAEGRLVLCDAITYSYRFNPSIIIDIATLTGACSIALGEGFSGLMSNNNNLSKEIIDASNEFDDKIWQLPLTKEYKYQIESNIADMKNIGNGKAGTIVAGYFLYHFIKKGTSWAHLDIASTAYNQEKKSTGRPIYALIQFLINKSKKLKN